MQRLRFQALVRGLRNYSKMSDYSGWSKEQLLERISVLEGQLGNFGGPQSEPSAQPPTDSSSLSSSSSHSPQPKKKKKEIDFTKYSTRKVAFRFSYIGWDYNGLAVQPNADPKEVKTVEQEILNACLKTKLITSLDMADCDFSRCGRTDRGVSALRQVISMRVRSVLSPEDQLDPANDSKELDYLHILNNLLPSDIRFYEVAMRPGEDFDARFSCLGRHYKYFFSDQGLDIDSMNRAAQYFLGDHDFRNYCKVDASKQIANFRRKVMSSSIQPQGGDLYCFDLRGTAFLWHQVRSMIAILFLVGQGHESPEIVQTLLDMDKCPTRPVYEMGQDYPLVLYDCEFPQEVQWQSFRSFETMQRTKEPAFNIWHEQYIKSAMANEVVKMLESSSRSQLPERNSTRTFINVGGGKGRPLHAYSPLLNRPRLDPPELVNKRWLEKKNRG